MKKKIVFKRKFEVLKEEILKEILKRKPGEKLPTEEQLVEIYGVNRGTINKVLSFLEHEGLIERKTKIGSIIKPVEERKLNYRIGVLVERATGHLYEKLTHLIIREIQKSKYFPLIVDETPNPGENVIIHLEEILDNNPEFIIVDGVGDFPFKFLKENFSRIKNLIFINKFETDIKFKATYILSDYEYGGYIGAKYLIEKGVKNILVVTQAVPPYKPNIDIERIEGVKKACREYGIEFNEENLILNRDDDYLKERLNEEFKKKKKIDGIFAFADYVGRKVQKFLEEIGIWLDIDYKMIGYFNTPYSTDFEPKIPSISINEKKIAGKLGEILKEGKFPKKIFKIEPELKEMEVRPP
ncbi:MAG: GntR family transcriptional regulator [Candidatus Ratteibacteria bacterium]